MKIRFYLALAAAALVMTNCSKDEEVVNGTTGTKSFTATIEGSSRSEADPETGAFSWTAGDKISVYNGSTFDVYANSEGNENNFVAESDEAGTATKYAIYPAGSHSVSGEVVTVNLPAEYTYGSTNAPMLAAIEGTNLSFKHLAGVMRFVVKNVPTGASKFVFTATGDIITGNYAVDSEGEIKKDGENAVSNNNSVTIKFEVLTAAQDMVFYVPLPVGTYGDYTVQIQSEDGTTVALENESGGVSNTIGRRTLLLMPEFTVGNGQLEKGAGSTIPVTQGEAAISGNQSVTINTESTGTNATLQLNYTPQEGNATLSLSDGSTETTPTTSVATVKVAPQGTTPVETLNINTPTLTVELGDGTYRTVNALTATETLKIGSGVKIETLVLNGGKVEIADGATIEKFIVKDSDALTTAIAAGGNVTLAADITNVSGLIKVEKDLVLDLGGHTLGFTPQTGYPGIKNTAKFEVKNGKITSTQVGIQNNGTLTIDCTLESVENAINNVYDGETTINGGTYKNTSTEKALINTNNHGDGTPVLTINGGTFESAFTNVSYNNGSTGAVNAGTFTCTTNWHNIYVGGENGGCNVTYKADNCTFSSNGINIQVNDWGKGNTNTVNGTSYTATTTLME